MTNILILKMVICIVARIYLITELILIFTIKIVKLYNY